MAAPSTDAGLDTWIAEQWDEGSNLPRPRWLNNRETARTIYQQMSANPSNVVSLRTSRPELQVELAALRRRVVQLERMVGTPSNPKGSIMSEALTEAFEQNAKQVRQLFDRHEERIAELERSRIKYCGVDESGSTYKQGSMVTRAGSLWYATKETAEAPGNGNTSWQLCVKRGDAARST